MALTDHDKGLLNNATPGLKAAGLGDIIADILEQLDNGGGTYTLPAATTADLGGVKKAANVAPAAAGTEVATINSIITNLQASGAML